jgi:O-antigen/teichoic acid export membrane protein
MSFARILRSSALMGGAQVATLLVAFVRTKVIAQLMGPAGVGLVGVLTAFNGNVSTLVGWGLGASGVRIIASAPSEERAAKQAAVRKFGLTLSSLGLVVTVAFFWPVAYITFDSSRYALELLVGGMAVPCIIASMIWTSILQASGQVKTLANAQIISAIGGLFIGLPLIYFFGTIGIAFSLLLAAALPMIFTWQAVRRDCGARDIQPQRGDLRILFSMGGGLMVIGVAAQLASYAVRLVIIKHRGADVAAGLGDAGYYQAAIAIAGSLPAMVFTAMGTDFFPRVAAAKDEAEAKVLSEKQIEAALLLALPIFTGLITMNRLGISLLYADKFEPAVPLLSWMIWGVFVRLLGWPLGYWLVARGSMRTVVAVEVTSNLVMAALPIVLLPAFGLVGTAIGYFIGYLLYALAMLVVVRHRTGQWLCLRTLSWFGLAAVLLLGAQLFAALAKGGYWSLLPTGLVAIGCLLTYRRALSSQS